MSPTEPLPYAIIIPARDEAPCIVQVIAELRTVVGPDVPIVVGVNGSRDSTAELARGAGALVAETPHSGYGHGCQAAVDLLEKTGAVRSYIFFAGDGADDPRDIAALLREHEIGATMVLGCRTTNRANWNLMNLHYVIANRLLGLFCGVLTGRFYADLGPLRLIERALFHRLQLREWTFGWTIEAQIRATLLGARCVEVPVRYRSRIAGVQKVSHVSAMQTIRVGLKIVAAAFRTRARALRG